MKAFLFLILLVFVYNITNVLRSGQIDCYTDVYKRCLDDGNEKQVCVDQFSLCIKNVH